jgi:hypothetical protein
MEMIDYLLEQRSRMNSDQQELVDRVAKNGDPSKLENERLAQLYLWLHMGPGSVAHRRFTSDLPIKGRRARR